MGLDLVDVAARANQDRVMTECPHELLSLQAPFHIGVRRFDELL